MSNTEITEWNWHDHIERAVNQGYNGKYIQAILYSCVEQDIFHTSLTRRNFLQVLSYHAHLYGELYYYPNDGFHHIFDITDTWIDDWHTVMQFGSAPYVGKDPVLYAAQQLLRD